MASLKTETMLVRIHSPIIVRAMAEAITILGSTLILLLVLVEANKILGHTPGFLLLLNGEIFIRDDHTTWPL